METTRGRVRYYFIITRLRGPSKPIISTESVWRGGVLSGSEILLAQLSQAPFSGSLNFFVRCLLRSAQKGSTWLLRIALMTSSICSESSIPLDPLSSCTHDTGRQLIRVLDVHLLMSRSSWYPLNQAMMSKKKMSRHDGPLYCAAFYHRRRTLPLAR